MRSSDSMMNGPPVSSDEKIPAVKILVYALLSLFTGGCGSNDSHKLNTLASANIDRIRNPKT